MYGPSVLAIERRTRMAIGRPIPVLRLTDDEREALERWTRRPTTAQALAQRARVILACASGRTNTRVARELRLTKQTVGKWRSRFVAARLDGLLDEPRPGAPRRISDAQVEQMVTLTLEATPREATHWSTRAMATRCGLSQSTVSRIWRAFGLQPHRTEAFKLSKDPLFVEKVRDIVGLYLNPPDRAVHPALVEQAPTIQFALQPHGRSVDHPVGALVCHPHREADPPRRASEHARA